MRLSEGRSQHLCQCGPDVFQPGRRWACRVYGGSGPNASAGLDGPAGQNIHPDAAVTVVLYRDLKVTANFAYRAGELTAEEIKQVLAAVQALAEKG